MVLRHFRWMREHDLDGAALQRFVIALQSQEGQKRRDRVLHNVMRASQSEGRAFFVMYDISGADPDRFVDTTLDDWRRLLESERLAGHPRYWHHGGKPVVAVWGLGFKGRPGSVDQAKRLVAALRATPGGVTLIGGVPTWWRTLSGDAKPEPGWADVYAQFDIISPWSVGRYGDERSWKMHLVKAVEPDIEALALSGRGTSFMPVIFPGFSFRNGGGNDEARFDKIPRRCGEFYWMQARDLLKSGKVTMLYTAMLDEFDEGTAIIPVAESEEEMPRGAKLITRHQSGCAQPSDWYLQIAGRISGVLHGERDLLEKPLSSMFYR